eukprot:TRINITY_DN6768_c0_g2_i3.p1 TRINITY_DN6768_c0_g2~~TRINITY_DN6768_c0_g2_i3.p1  ORF type:complete len:322 (-),score=38.15 TRINITY_DN6768_c0_g2_i3:504-1433(-)
MNGDSSGKNQTREEQQGLSAEKIIFSVQDSNQSNQQWYKKIGSQSRTQFHRFETEGKTGANQSQSGRTSPQQAWRKKIQCLLCCFHPRNVDYSSAEFDEGMGGEARGGDLDKEQYLIGPMKEEDRNKKTLVLDLDETLVHSSFKPVVNPDYVIPVEVEGALTDVYVMRRPHLDHFMKQVCAKFEVVVFTASLSKYADPLLDLLDEHNMVRWRLFREACVHHQGAYVKDLTKLGRELRNILIVDNSPNSYIFQPENAIPILAFIDDMEDRALLELLPMLQDLATQFDVREGLKDWQTQMNIMNTPQLGTA